MKTISCISLTFNSSIVLVCQKGIFRENLAQEQHGILFPTLYAEHIVCSRLLDAMIGTLNFALCKALSTGYPAHTKQAFSNLLIELNIFPDPDSRSFVQLK